jgi:hypothetical protein
MTVIYNPDAWVDDPDEGHLTYADVQRMARLAKQERQRTADFKAALTPTDEHSPQYATVCRPDEPEYRELQRDEERHILTEIVATLYAVCTHLWLHAEPGSLAGAAFEANAARLCSIKERLEDAPPY